MIAVALATAGVVATAAPRLVGAKAADKQSNNAEGIVMVSSAYGMAETIAAPEGGHCRQGHPVLLADRPGQAGRRRRHQAQSIDVAGVRQSAARHPLHHRQRVGWPRLACAPARV